MDDGRLAVRVPGASDLPPRELADQSLAVYRRTRESLVPSGTGPYRPSRQPGSGLMLERVDSTLAVRFIEFLAAPGDARDLVDLGIDLLVTDHPGTLEYAAARPEFTVIALGWDRTYVLRVPGADSGSLSPAMVPSGFRESLASEAVRVDARPASRPAPGDACGSIPVPATEPARRRNATIMFPRDDPTAQALAERLVVIARSTGGEWLSRLLGAASFRGGPSATGVSHDEFWQALSRGEDAGYVVARSAMPPPCGLLWGVPAVDVIPPRGATIELVDTRRHAVVRRGTARFVIDGHGWPVLEQSP
jgi:hypothetical protein